MRGRAGDAMLFHGLTTHIGSANAAGSRQPRVTQFARYCYRRMREQGPAVMFPNQDGTPWSPPARDANAAEEPEPPRIPGFLPPDHPDRRLERYEVSPDLWKYWGPALHGGAAVAEEQGDEVARSRSRSGSRDGTGAPSTHASQRGGQTRPPRALSRVWRIRATAGLARRDRLGASEKGFDGRRLNRNSRSRILPRDPARYRAVVALMTAGTIAIGVWRFLLGSPWQLSPALFGLAVAGSPC